MLIGIGIVLAILVLLAIRKNMRSKKTVEPVS
jgi:hypothetical protein